MRYINQGTINKYVSAIGKTLRPAAKGNESPRLSDEIAAILLPTGWKRTDRQWTAKTGIGVLLSDEDRRAIQAILDCDSRTRTADMSKAIKASKDPTGENKVYSATEDIRKERQAAVDAAVEKTGRMRATINSESSIILPDGRAVSRRAELNSKMAVAAAANMKQEFVAEPTGPEDIMRSNMAVEAGKATWSDTPKTGAEAVRSRHPVPGTPNFPELSDSQYGKEQESPSIRGFGHGFGTK